jgi:hypothetical protein
MNRAERIAKRIAAASGGSKTRLSVTVRFDEGATDAESLATAMDILVNYHRHKAGGLQLG